MYQRNPQNAKLYPYFAILMQELGKPRPVHYGGHPFIVDSKWFLFGFDTQPVLSYTVDSRVLLTAGLAANGDNARLTFVVNIDE